MINPKEFMIDLKGKQYLPVAPRIVMMREAHPDWAVHTEPIMFGEIPLVMATITDEAGRLIATAHKTVTSFRGFEIEKAETGAIGRALSIAGFGTIQAGDMEEGEQIADSPIEPVNGNGKQLPQVKTGTATFKEFMVLGSQLYGDEWDDKRAELCSAISKGRTKSSKELTPAELGKLVSGLRERAS